MTSSIRAVPARITSDTNPARPAQSRDGQPSTRVRIEAIAAGMARRSKAAGQGVTLFQSRGWARAVFDFRDGRVAIRSSSRSS